MKKKFSLLILSSAVFAFGPQHFAQAADAAAGKDAFVKYCNACHMGGKNVINPMKTLKKEDLEKYGKFSLEAIVTLVTNGAGAMPGFKSQMKPEDIENVAAYVLEQAEADWK